MWEALPAIEVLIEHLDKMKQIFTQETHPELASSINLAWLKLDDYYQKLDDSPAYAAALLLYPRYRMRHFENKWKGQLKKYLGLMKKATRAIYDTEYAPQEVGEENEPESPQEEIEDDDCLRTYLDGETSDTIEDQFKYFITADPISLPHDQLYDWWSEQEKLPNLRQMAYDLLSIPAMSAETERTFSDTKLTIPPSRTCLGADIVEAQECLQAWYKAGF
jgi:hypothetical protein